MNEELTSTDKLKLQVIKILEIKMMKDLEQLFDEKNGPVVGFNWLQNKIILS